MGFIQFTPGTVAESSKVNQNFAQTVHLTDLQKTTNKVPVSSLVTVADGGTVTFDCNLGSVFLVTLGGNRTLAVSNFDVGQSVIFRLKQDVTGSRTVSWFAGIRWAGGVVPTLTTTAGKEDIFGITCVGPGDYVGFVLGQNL
jgi:hypothetical protein